MAPRHQTPPSVWPRGFGDLARIANMWQPWPSARCWKVLVFLTSFSLGASIHWGVEAVLADGIISKNRFACVRKQLRLSCVVGLSLSNLANLFLPLRWNTRTFCHFHHSYKAAWLALVSPSADLLPLRTFTHRSAFSLDTLLRRDVLSFIQHHSLV